MKITKQKILIFVVAILMCFFPTLLEEEKNLEVNNSVKVEEGQNLEVHFIDVGQADSILLKQGENTMLIDGGNNEDGKLVVDYLAKQNVKDLDYVIATHPHEDHIGGLDVVIDNVPVKKIYAPKKTSTTKTFKDFVLAAKKKDLKFTMPVKGETFKLGNATCKILSPIREEYEETNDYSIVMKVTFGNKSFMFTGDAEALVEKDILKEYSKDELKVDVLKLGHHGSVSSSTNEFLDATNPSICAIEVGEGNKYGHPHKETMDKINKRNIKCYRTDRDKDIVMITDGENIEIKNK